ncbi:MAG TPA: hypothetical protein ENH55_20265 [Aurantimonas coralicida]|uniref:Uncharacterized protein n=1 Tax=Aurantimonas coralicida TaxID=182270 RepID=A0A9C9NG91_9HYPH|nr:hypothetical protein [Aurantimonas coralicida]HEU00775.1 hypothetical protein [Aurantimonas coralicida]
MRAENEGGEQRIADAIEDHAVARGDIGGKRIEGNQQCRQHSRRGQHTDQPDEIGPGALPLLASNGRFEAGLYRHGAFPIPLFERRGLTSAMPFVSRVLSVSGVPVPNPSLRVG